MEGIGVYNFENHYKGDTFKAFTFNFNLDLTGIDIKIQFRKGRKAGILKKSIEIGDGITVADPTNGVMVIDAFIMDFEVDTYFYDIQFTYPTGTVKTWIEGSIKMIQDTTR